MSQTLTRRASLVAIAMLLAGAGLASAQTRLQPIDENAPQTLRDAGQPPAQRIDAPGPNDQPPADPPRAERPAPEPETREAPPRSAEPETRPVPERRRAACGSYGRPCVAPHHGGYGAPRYHAAPRYGHSAPRYGHSAPRYGHSAPRYGYGYRSRY